MNLCHKIMMHCLLSVPGRTGRQQLLVLLPMNALVFLERNEAVLEKKSKIEIREKEMVCHNSLLVDDNAERMRKFWL